MDAAPIEVTLSRVLAEQLLEELEQLDTDYGGSISAALQTVRLRVMFALSSS